MFDYVTRLAYEIRHRHVVNRLFYIHLQLSLVGDASASVFVCFHRQAPSTKKKKQRRYTYTIIDYIMLNTGNN